MITVGEIGVWKVKGNQIGGFLQWEADVDLQNINTPKVNLTARALWLFEDVDLQNVEVVLYAKIDGKLEIVNESPVEIHTAIGEIPDSQLVHRSVEMVFRHERPAVQ